MTAALHWQSVTVRRQGRALLDAVELVVPVGSFVAVVGPNGAGKTTLLSTALDLVRPTSGAVRTGGRPVGDLAPRARAAAIGWLPQHGPTREPVTALSRVAAARYRFDEPRRVSERAAADALAEVGAAALAPRSMHTLSGGEAQRVALAGLVAQEAAVWLLDEPANHLDPRVQVDLYRHLARAWRAGRTIVCVTHDVNLLAHLGDVRVVGLEEGRLRFDTPFASDGLPDALTDLFGLPFHALHAGGLRHLVAGAQEGR